MSEEIATTGSASEVKRADAERGIEWVALPCPLCASVESDPAYERAHETGSALGRFRKLDVLCRDCGFMYTSPRPSAADMRRYYAEASGASGAVYHSLVPGSRLHDLTLERARFMERLIEAHVVVSSGAILDIGCAFGDLLSGLHLPGWRKVGLEPSTAAARVGRDRGLEILDGDIESTPLATEAFDVVTCISALEHVWDLPLALEKISKATTREGLVFLEVPDSLRPVAQIAEFYSFEHLSHFTRGSLTRALRNVGLEPVAFDEDVSIPNLRVCARPLASMRRSSVETDDRADLVAALDRYREERRALEEKLVGRIEDRVTCWRREGARVAIYGAGMHTRFLLGLFDLSSSVCCVLDSDPGKAGTRFLGWTVHGPAELPALGLDAILISTNAFEAEVFDAIAPSARLHGIEVVRCYG